MRRRETMILEEPPEAVQCLRRLCSEIQLFDLCDLKTCRYRDGHFCTSTDLLARFEQIAEKDESAPLRTARDDDEDDERDGYDTVFDDGEFGEGDDEED